MDPPTTSSTTTTTTTTPTPPSTSPPPTTSPPTTTPPTSPPSTTTPPSTGGSSSGSTSQPSSSQSSASASSTAPPSISTSAPQATQPATTPGHITFVTSSVVVTAPTGPTTTNVANGVNAGGNKKFFDNKGAVAGVFTVVGLVALALFVALVTNIIRRRRARKFDREIAEAAEEAAKAPAPVFLDDDGDDYPRPGHYNLTRNDYSDYGNDFVGGYGGGGNGGGGGGNGGGGGGPYSDVSSHGTYSQPPMTTAGGTESYNMHDMGHHATGVGELYNPYTAAAAAGVAGAAGVGVARARSTRDPGQFANGLNEGSAPYAAFAGPTYGPGQGSQNGYNNGGGGGNGAYGNGNGGAYGPAGAGGYPRGPGSPEFDLLDAAGMNHGNGNDAPPGAAIMGLGAGGVQRGMSLSHNQQQQQPQPTPQQQYAAAGPQRSMSQGNRSAESAYSSSVYTQFSAGYPSGGNGGQGGPHQQPPMPSHYAPSGGAIGGGQDDEGEDAYGGYVGEHEHALVGPNPHLHHPQHVIGGQEGESEDDDGEQGRGAGRVLRVANE